MNLFFRLLIFYVLFHASICDETDLLEEEKRNIICEKNVTEPKEVTVVTQVQSGDWYFCWSHIICTVDEYVDKVTTEIHNVTQTKLVCCEGYHGDEAKSEEEDSEEEEKNLACLPTCENDCSGMGICTEPYVCKCDDGVFAFSCDYLVKEPDNEIAADDDESDTSESEEDPIDEDDNFDFDEDFDEAEEELDEYIYELDTEDANQDILEMIQKHHTMFLVMVTFVPIIWLGVMSMCLYCCYQKIIAQARLNALKRAELEEGKTEDFNSKPEKEKAAIEYYEDGKVFKPYAESHA